MVDFKSCIKFLNLCYCNLTSLSYGMTVDFVPFNYSFEICVELNFTPKNCTYSSFKRNETWKALIQKQPPEVFCKKGILRNFAKFTGKHMCQKKETLAQVFSCEFCKIYKNTFSKNTSGINNFWK